MAGTKDFYDLLGVSRKASADEIRKAYRKLALKHHPDVSDAPDAAARFAEIQEAYDVLADEEKRKTYDQFGVAGVRGAGMGSGGTGSPFGGRGPDGVRYQWSGTGGGAQDFDIPDLGSIFEEVFGGRTPFGGGGGGARGGGARTATRGPAPQRGRDIYHTATVPFMSAALGGTESLRVMRGTGDSESFDVKIPAGIEDGGKLRLRGRGNPGAGGGEAGDIILTVRVGKHPYFRREGLDVLLDVPITIAEAALGVAVTVPLLKGSAELKVPAGTSSGSRLRIRERGIAPAQGRAGDFFAVVQIAAPREMPVDLKAQLEELQSKLKNPRESAPWADAVGKD
jgi:DnaJ-class molecular chaperone